MRYVDKNVFFLKNKLSIMRLKPITIMIYLPFWSASVFSALFGKTELNPNNDADYLIGLKLFYRPTLLW